jgi:RimJ/RimL family protein N-acetyltransferase
MFVHAKDPARSLELRKLEKDYVGRVLEIRETNWDCFHRPLLANTTDQKEWFAQLDSNPYTPRLLVLQAKIDDRLIGYAMLTDIDYINRSAGLSCGLETNERGKGQGKLLMAAASAFAFDVLNLLRIDAEVLETNPASAKCLQAAGFKLIGTKTGAVLRGTQMLDSNIYELLACDFTD